jgi:hypothetical protein
MGVVVSGWGAFQQAHASVDAIGLDTARHT